jgi:hypothetical protein
VCWHLKETKDVGITSKLPLRSLTYRSRSRWYSSAAIEQTKNRPVRKHRAFLFAREIGEIIVHAWQYCTQ